MTTGPVQLIVSGFRISEAIISPLDLVEIGILRADELQLHDLESTAAARRGRRFTRRR
jgi:hypothetical protein